MAKTTFGKGFVTTLGVLAGILFFVCVIVGGCAILVANVGSN